MLDRVTAQLDSPPEVVVVRGEHGDHTAYASLLEQRADRHEMPVVDPDAVRMILYTSGTTGRPKGVLHSHNSIHALICQIRDHWLVEPGDKFLVPSPIAHIGGSIYAFECPLLLGATAVLMERWDPDEAVTIMARRGVHPHGRRHAVSRGTACRGRTRRYPAARPEGVHLRRRVGAAVADPQGGSVFRPGGGDTRLRVDGGAGHDRRLAHRSGARGGHRRPRRHRGHQAGRARRRAVRDGEIHARGPQMLVGYRNPEDERDAFDDEGYFRTGDLAQWVDDDYLVVTGRAKDIIIRSGENISPKEIEDILGGHPDIVEISVVGLPDARTGERACAVIVPKASPGPDVDSLRGFLATRAWRNSKCLSRWSSGTACPRTTQAKS